MIRRQGSAATATVDAGSLEAPPTGATSPVALIALGVLGASMSILMPGFLGALTAERGLSASFSAMVASGELGGMTLATIVVAFAVGRLRARYLFATALLVAAVANLLTAVTTEPSMVLASRVLAGLGEGALLTVVAAQAAGMRSPERIFALLIATNMGWAAAMFWVMARIMEDGGVGSLFLSFAGLNLAGLLLLPLIAHVGAETRQPASAGTKSGFGMAGLMGLGGTVLFFAAVGTVWPLMQRIGTANGVSPEATASALSIATLVGVMTGLCTSWLGPRIPRLLALLIGTCGLGVTMTVLAVGQPGLFAALVASFMLWWMFSVPFYTGMMAAIDRSGRLAAFSMTMQFCGMAFGPALTSLIIGDRSLNEAGWIGAALCGAAAATMIGCASLTRSRAAAI